MAYNKTSEERKCNYWKEQEEKKLRELGMEEEKIQKLRQMDREDFLEERRYREHLDETMQDMDSIKQRDRGRFAQDIRELLDNIGDRRIYELLKGTEHQTLEILLLSTWGYSGREIAKIMGMEEQTVYTKRNRLRKKWLNHKFCGISDSSRSSVGSYRIASERNIRHQDIRIPVCEES